MNDSHACLNKKSFCDYMFDNKSMIYFDRMKKQIDGTFQN